MTMILRLLQCVVSRLLLLLPFLLSLSTLLLVSSEIQLPKIELQRVHLQYETTTIHDRSVQEFQQTVKYEPIRIVFDTRVLDSLYNRGNVEVDAKIDFIKSTILPQTAQKWLQHLYVIPVLSQFTSISIGPDACNGWYADTLVETISYNNADLVIIVGGDPSNLCDGGTLAYAVPCGFEQMLDRPVIGTFHFCLNKLSSTSLQIGDGTSTLQRLTGSNIPAYYSAYTNTTFYPERLGISILDVTIHEVAHILGFSDILYPYTRTEDGLPRVPRDINNFNQPLPIQRLCGNGTTTFGYYPTDSIVQVQPSIIDPNRYEQYYITERIQAISRMHFNCSTLMGARLEDISNDGRQCFGAHWHERLYYGELLSPTVSEGSENVLSLLTLAFLEDTGWYKVDYRGAGYSSFGLNAGCDFVYEPCINSTTGDVLDVAQNEFCNTPLYLDNFGAPELESLNSILCDPSHQSWVICDLSDIGAIDVNEPTYFPDAFLSTIIFQRADNCPIPSLNLGIDCFDDSVAYNSFYAGESVGPSSRCLNAYTDSSSLGRSYRPACIRVTCDMTERVVRIGQNDTAQICEFDGQLLTVPGARTDGATIVCPRLASVCPALFTCPDGCFGRGDCIYNLDSNGRTVPSCRCFDGNNTHISCAPSFIIDRVTNAPTVPVTPSPVSILPPSFTLTTSSPVLPPSAILPPVPQPPTLLLSPNGFFTNTRAPTLRQVNTDVPTPRSSSAKDSFVSCHTIHFATITLLMSYLIGRMI